jgi:hypothetical protein
MDEFRLRTPKGNQILVINATDVVKFSASFTVFSPNENWLPQWEKFRGYLSGQYEWQDIPK